MKKLIDLQGKEIKEGDILTFDWFTEGDPIKDMRRKFSHMKDWTDKEISDRIHQPTFVVRKTDEGILFGEGIDTEKRLYLHNFRFKHTKVVNQ